MKLFDALSGQRANPLNTTGEIAHQLVGLDATQRPPRHEDTRLHRRNAVIEVVKPLGLEVSVKH
jgi:hypothetical protein